MVHNEVSFQNPPEKFSHILEEKTKWKIEFHTSDGNYRIPTGMKRIPIEPHHAIKHMWKQGISSIVQMYFLFPILFKEREGRKA